jgi:Cu(I)/Ag(I) efflux system membrane fusion protein
MNEAQVVALERSGAGQARFTVTAPRSGVVGELAVREGATVMAGAELLRINGLDTVWIEVAIPEAQVARVRARDRVTAEVAAFPGESFPGETEALLANLDPTTRTQTARVVLRNPGHRLVPGMFAQVEIASGASARERVLVPSEAVVATGTRAVVIVAEGGGRFRAQEVRLGQEADGKSEILEGVGEGDEVVLSGQFLIDSEASLSGTLARLEGGHGEHRP